MNRKVPFPPHQTPLPLNGDVHWTQLPAKVRDQCRVLVVELLKNLARCQVNGVDDDER
jgi:hypothetical protein